MGGMEEFLEMRWGPIPIGCVETPFARLLVDLLPERLWFYELQSHSTISQCKNKLFSHHRAGLCRPAGEIGYRPRLSVFLKRAQDSMSSHCCVALIMSEP